MERIVKKLLFCEVGKEFWAKMLSSGESTRAYIVESNMSLGNEDVLIGIYRVSYVSKDFYPARVEYDKLGEMSIKVRFDYENGKVQDYKVRVKYF